MREDCMSVVGAATTMEISRHLIGSGDVSFVTTKRGDRYLHKGVEVEVKGTRKSDPCTFYNAFLTSSSQES